ncbi:MAG: cation-transporting P-type ATPase [Chloroflexi bacterium]|nr:cation-transporting P-type ATPase [Chloroflexota bacterium]
MQTLLGKHWHHLPASEIVELLDSNLEKGLDVFEIKHRHERFGRNVLTPKKGKSPLVRFLLQFHNPLLYILMVASVITLVVKQEPVDALVIFGAVLVNVIIGYIQESKAEKAIEALAQAMTTEATVIRSGKRQRIDATELVSGDIVALQAGDKVPADLRLVRSRDLQVAEAALTGESVAVEKHADVQLPPETILAERRNLAFASTLVTYGQATGVVIAIGDNTEVGRISQLISTATELATPLTRKIAEFSKIVLYAILALAGLTLVIEWAHGASLLDTLTAAIAFAVAMIPEGLPAALTVTLAIGVSRMARRRAIIRKLPAVEALGSTTVICSDKTGTLTQNQMTVQHIVASSVYYNVTGAGYTPTGQIVAADSAPSQNVALTECLTAGLLCNDSALVEKDGRWYAQGDPTEVALIVAARKAKLTAPLPRVDTLPFESQHQYMATLHTLDSGQRVYVKGAVEVLLERCANALDAAGQTVPLDAEKNHRDVDAMALRGLRVLAFARKDVFNAEKISHADVASGLTFLGLQGIIDPPREEAIAAVRACQTAGIQVKMITGDHALTASAIACEIGLADSCQAAAITGKQIAEMTDEALIDAAARTPVFARVSPEQKLRLVDALQARGNVVAMTGDGVNDGPALKQADIGIAMGLAGTDVAKEAADMVLTDDNFATIRSAVEEGRGVFDNLTKIIAWTLPTNLGEGMIILVALILNLTLPILPIQILWINMATVAALGLVLAVEPKEPNVMRRAPRNPDAPILTRELLGRVALVGGLILIAALFVFEYALISGNTLAQARTAAVNAVVVIEIFYLLNCRSLTQSMFQIGLWSNRWVIVGIGIMIALQLLFTYAPFMNTLFGSAPIPLITWMEIGAFGGLTYVVVEIEKWLRRRKEKG